MHFRQIEVFHAFMITGSTIGAAAHLNVTQPAVSTTLKRLQDELKLTLFTSVRGRLVPTPEAQTLFQPIRAIHEDIAQLEHLARKLAEGRTGYVRLGVVPALSDGVIARALGRMAVDRPIPQVAVEVLNTHELVHRLQAGRLDVAFVFGRPEHLSLRALHVFDVPLLCVVPGAWVEGRTAMALEDLAQFPVAAMRATDPIGLCWDAALRQAGTSLETRIELRSCRAAIAMAREGLCIGLSDPFSLAETAMGDAIALPFRPALTVPMTVAVKSDHASSALESYLVETMVDVVSSAL